MAVATKTTTKTTTNGYVCFYKGKRYEVYAETSYEAQVRCACENKIRRRQDITVILAEKGGEQVVHTFM